MKKYLIIVMVSALVAMAGPAMREEVLAITAQEVPAYYSPLYYAAPAPVVAPPVLQRVAARQITPIKKYRPREVNLPVPFQSQAPFGDWKLPYKESCEEAAAIMLHYYLTGQELDAATMQREILALIAWEKATFGYYEDTNAAQEVQILRDYFGHANVKVRYDGFTLEDVKNEISSGHPVIIFAAGALLKNPFFQNPPPRYHVLVIKGYAKGGRLITNDPGTKHGHDFRYSPAGLMKALHEWNSKDILYGRRAMVFIDA